MPIHPHTIQLPMASPSIMAAAAACVVGLSLAPPVRIGADRAPTAGAMTAVTPGRDGPNDALRFDGHDGFYATVELVSVCEEPVDHSIERYTLMIAGESQRPGSVPFRFVSSELRRAQVGDLFTAHLRPICDASGRSNAAGSIGGCVYHPDVVLFSIVDLVPIGGRSLAWSNQFDQALDGDRLHQVCVETSALTSSDFVGLAIAGRSRSISRR